MLIWVVLLLSLLGRAWKNLVINLKEAREVGTNR